MPNDRVDGEWQVLGVSYRSLVKPDWQQAALTCHPRIVGQVRSDCRPSHSVQR